MKEQKWYPLNPQKLKEIEELFSTTYPESEYGNLAEKIGDYWIELLKKSWEGKSEELKALDLAYDPSDPLSRVSQKTTIITYADSISRKGEESLKTLDEFMKKWFPAVGGLHILPACTVVEDRFNDGYFSQVERNSIHRAFGSNDFFADLVHRYFSMNDLVMGHVDIENPAFRAYLEGDDEAGRTFYTFTAEEYEKLKASGSFDNVFRPRPFPLFSIFRRLPEFEPYRSMTYEARVDYIKNLIREETGVFLEPPVLGILYLFEKVLNDQMLLDEDFRFISDFILWFEERGFDPEIIFEKSVTQEVQHTPWIFRPEIDSRIKLLESAGFLRKDASTAVSVFEREHWRIFGREIRALTTFSHVQVDVNTATFEGLKRFGEDLIWYLTMDLNMLRLDAVNYAFKKWGTSCFGLPELDKLMKIVYLSMDCISPRIIPNLEVNDSLTTILNQMTSGDAAPPMMHDFQLASLLPAVFHLQNPSIIKRIFDKIDEYDVPRESIRFSLSESHDGKSVRGSMDLLNFKERSILTRAVLTNGGFVKYKSIPPGVTARTEFESFCREVELDPANAETTLFIGGDDDSLTLKTGIQALADIYNLFPVLTFGGKREIVQFYFTRLFEGRDPYELCITTRNSLPKLEMGGEDLEAERFLAFETLALAIMGRNVKTIYFNDLLGLPNDHPRVERSGELRDIKRTKTDYDEILPALENPGSFTSIVVRGINDLISLVDSEPALNFQGEEASLIELPGGEPTAVILNRCGEAFSITLVNLSPDSVSVNFKLPEDYKDRSSLKDRFSGVEFTAGNSRLSLELPPFGRLWLVP